MRLKDDGSHLSVRQDQVFSYLYLFIFFGIGISLLISKQSSWLFAACFIGLPLIGILLIERESVLVDMGMQMIIVKKKSLVKHDRQEIPFHSIAAIEMREMAYNGSKGGTNYSYPLYAVLKDGTSVHMVQESGKGGIGAKLIDTSNDERKIGQAMAQRIGVEFRVQGAPSITEMFTMMKQVVSEKMDEAKIKK